MSKVLNGAKAKLFVDGELIGGAENITIGIDYHDPIKVLILDDTFVDATGDIMPTNAHVKYDRDITITKDFSNHWEDVIGVGRLYRQGNEFFVKDIHYTSEDMKRLVMDSHLYPCVQGKKLEKENNKLTQFTIDSIGLTLDPNTDSRIKSIKNQLDNYDE